MEASSEIDCCELNEVHFNLKEIKMGSLIPNPMDQEIVFRLNTIFSGNAFTAVASHNDADGLKLFDPSKRLSRIARRIGAYPQSQNDTDPSNPTQPGRRNPRARWYFFLESLETLHDPSGTGSPTTADAIKNALQNAITNSYPGKNIVGVVFNATYATTPGGHPSTVYLEPNNTNPGHIWQIGGTNNHVLCLTLICQHHIKGGPISHQNNPGASETPIANLPWPVDDQDQNQP
jgi:hypothetical protein